jgi:hypothetical protein
MSIKPRCFFSRNTYLSRRQEILHESGLAEAHRIDVYLGLPSFVGKSEIQTFSYIKDKVIKRLSNWKNQFLTQAGKEILIKAIVQAIPSYSMGVFKIPTSLCKELNDLMQSFWWNHMSRNFEIHWMSWRNMGISKAFGGLGFRDLIIFNQALLAKQGWHIIQNPNSLVSRLLRANIILILASWTLRLSLDLLLFGGVFVVLRLC